MAKKEWKFNLEDGEHIVTLEHGYLSGKKKIHVDNRLLLEKRNFADIGGEFPFTINDHTGFVLIKTNGLTFSYDLVLDGLSMKTGKNVEAKMKMPLWTWLFIILCLLIPVISIGGAMPTLIGGGGALICMNITKNSKWSNVVKILFCIMITVIAFLLWFISLGLIGMYIG